MKQRNLFVWMGCLCVGVAVFAAWSVQPSATAQDPKPKSKEETSASFEARFWGFLQSVQYHNWAPGPKQGLEPFRGTSPHGTYLKMYVNRAAAADPKSPPHGSIVVLENYGKDKARLLFITAMYRVKGYDPEHNDWYWVKYNPDGTVARTTPGTGSKPIAGKFKACIDCHARAKGGDFFYSNDK